MSQRIADDFAAINARLAEIEAEKSKAKEEPKTDQPNPNWSSIYGTYQAPDDYMGFKTVLSSYALYGPAISLVAPISRLDGKPVRFADWASYQVADTDPA